MIRRLELIFVMTVVLTAMPSVTLANASLQAPAAQACTNTTSVAVRQQAALTAVGQEQLAALERIHARLVGLIDQAAVQGRQLTELQADADELERRTASLRQSFGILNQTTATLVQTCGTATSRQAALERLAAVRAEVAALRQWYAAQPGAHLQALAAGRS